MSKPPGNEVLRTSVHVLAPIWLLAILTGVIFKFSLWFGVTLSIFLIGAVCSICYKIVKTSEVSVKLIEVVLINMLVHLLATLSILSSSYYIQAALTINILLFASAFPHLLLTIRSREKLSHPFLLTCSSLWLIESIVTMFFIHDMGRVIPTITTAIYALVLVSLSIYDLRKKLPIRPLRFAFLVLTPIFSVSTYISFFYSVNFCAGLTTASVASVLLFFFLDFCKHTETCHLTVALGHVACDAFDATLVVLWGVCGYLLDGSVSNPDLFGGFMVLWIVLLFLHAFHESRKMNRRRDELNPYFKKLMLASVGLMLYTIATCYYVAYTVAPMNAPTNLNISEGNATNATGILGISDNDNLNAAMIVQHPLFDVLLTSLSLFVVLLFHFAIALDEQEARNAAQSSVHNEWYPIGRCTIPVR